MLAFVSEKRHKELLFTVREAHPCKPFNVHLPLPTQDPGEAEIEVWLNGAHAYMELENQGQYTLFLPGDTLEYVVKWYLRKLPSDISVAVGSQNLVTYAKSTARIEPSATRKIVRTRLGASASPKPVVRMYTGSSHTVPASKRQEGYNLRGERVKRPNSGVIVELP